MENALSGGHTSIIHLPDDCLSFIFSRLDCNYDRESFGLTCHRWLNIQNVGRQSLQFHCSLSMVTSRYDTNFEVSSYHLYRLLTRFQHLQYLSLSGCTELPDSGLTHLQYYGSKLHTLYLDCCLAITDDGLSVGAACCRSLEVISLYRCNVTDAGLMVLASSCFELKHVNLSHCTRISDHGLRALCQACRKLLAVKVSICRDVTGIGFRGCSPTLTYINAEGCKLEPEGITEMVSGGGLEYLDVAFVSWWICGHGFEAIGSGFASRLKILNFRMCRTVGDESIIAIAKGCPLLQEWNLALCHGVKLLGWQSIGLNCNNLKKLHVNRCKNLFDRGLQALRDGCNCLEMLYIDRSGYFSSTAVELFKLYRGDVEIKREEILCIGPDWTL
ncbi:RNI-like superfamily protein [Tripterygium wilfordii]|uniref:RNI-like superfamily protein n=1 Tax=Tripterygium wilfordii TaxID=458696 RepID=A0A7J7BX86_TRIWF|nr:F-box/LRR-repeat protein 12 [Tripterygium wilfordii]KAF5726509.1 RNI-like superfamily protein [Tripterygium wilfordii]